MKTSLPEKEDFYSETLKLLGCNKSKITTDKEI